MDERIASLESAQDYYAFDRNQSAELNALREIFKEIKNLN
jgi:hypothetical protein